MFRNSIRAHLVSGSAALLATAITVAAASPARAEPVQQRVAYGDLDLTSADGLATLDRRLRGAARAVCGSDQPGERLRVQACRRQAYQRARVNVAMADLAGVQTASLR